LIAQYPAINHAVILQEIRLLREEFNICTASVRAPDRPFEQLSPDEREEAKRTYYIKPAGAGSAFMALAAALGSSPLRFIAGLLYTVRLADFRLKQVARNLAYFAQAAMVGRWMRSNSLTHLHSHYSSTVALLVHKIFNVGISISFHGPDEFSDPAGFRIRDKVAACIFVRAISRYARSQLMMSANVSDWDKIEVIYMGVDPDTFSPRPSPRAGSPVEIICVGRLSPVKAQHILIGAIDILVQENQDVLLHIVGGGPDRQVLECEVAQRGLRERVIFHGLTPHNKVDMLYRKADIFALPSFAEGIPVVLMEAMATAIPCVSTWVAGIPELIRSGIDGLLVPPSDIEALAGAIRQLVTDPHLRLRIGQAGRERVLEKFDLRKNSAVFAGVIQKYCAKE
jgi:glycosyltransferase involved in cell wall biosynthesis